jgi:hypothetical protein
MVGRFAANPGFALKTAATAVFAFCLALFVAESIHWPLVGDASLMHYVVFLMSHGAAPYRDIAEMNMPGSYLAEWAAMHIFGDGALAWRWFDLFLTLIAIGAMVAITLPIDWFAGIWAGGLFLLIHGRDGVEQIGQRDLTLTVSLLVGYAFLFLALRKDWPWMALFFGLLAGFAAAIKPTMLPLGPMALFLAGWQLRRAQRPFSRLALAGAAGLLACWAGVGYFLWRAAALGAFSTIVPDMVAYHAARGRFPVGYLLLHSLSRTAPLLAAWVVILVLRRTRPSRESAHLLLALAFGMGSYLIQGKGYPYQRYPFVAFLLVTMALDFAAAIRAQGVARSVGFAALAYGAFALAPISAVKAGAADWRNIGTVGLLEKDLLALPQGELSGGVQCVDSIVACTNVLYRMKIVETSYVLYDEFLFGPPSAPAIRENRKKFWTDLQRTPPQVIVVTAPLFPDGPGNYAKLAAWPEFDELLRQQYSLHIQRTPTAPVKWWSREQVPEGYRIYLRDR